MAQKSPKKVIRLLYFLDIEPHAVEDVIKELKKQSQKSKNFAFDVLYATGEYDALIEATVVPTKDNPVESIVDGLRDIVYEKIRGLPQKDHISKSMSFILLTTDEYDAKLKKFDFLFYTLLSVRPGSARAIVDELNNDKVPEDGVKHAYLVIGVYDVILVSHWRTYEEMRSHLVNRIIKNHNIKQSVTSIVFRGLDKK